MVHKRRDFLITFTVLCLAMCACSGLQYLGSAFYLMVQHWVFSLESGGGRLLSGLFSSPWTGVLVQYVFSIGLPFLAVIPMTWFLRSDRRPAQKLSAEVWGSALFMALGLGYIFNFLGVFLDSFISIFTGVPAGDMNPVMDALDALTPGMVIYTCLVAPFMEELLFRGVLLRKARRFGDRTAVVFTAVMFGLMHGNLNQFLYAVVIGLVLGYLAVRTNRILYNVLLHMAVNSFSMLLVMVEDGLYALGLSWAAAAFSFASCLMVLLLIAAGIYFFFRDGRRYWWQMGQQNGVPTSYKKYVYLNPGFLFYVIIFGMEMLSYMMK